MKPYRRWLISQKLLFIILFVTATALSLAFAALISNDMNLFRQHQHRKLITLAEIIGRNTQAALAFNDSKAAEKTLSALRAEGHIVAAAVYLPNGKRFAAYHAADPSAKLPAKISRKTGGVIQNRNLHLFQPVTLDGKKIGLVYLQADQKEMRSLLRYYLILGVAIFLVSIGVAVILSFIFQSSISWPITDLTAVARQVSQEKNYAYRASKTTEDELGVLVDSFNGMLGEIEARERALKNQRKWLESVLDLMPTPLLLVELETGRVNFANRAADEMAGGKFPLNHPTEKYDEVYYCTDNRGERIPANLMPSARLARGEKIDGFVLDWHVAGGVKTLLVAGGVLPAMHGHAAVGVITFHDITDLKRVEQRLKQMADQLSQSNSELAHSNKDLEQFAYITSHDLQEPLRKIITFGDRLMDKLDRLEEEDRDYFMRIYNAAHRMKTVIEDLLQFSRISRQEAFFETVDLGEVLKDVLSDLEIRIAQSGARVRVDRLPRLEANRSQMMHLFQNLITNSIKFAKKDVPPQILIESQQLEDSVEIRVKDNGIGFDEKYVEKIFKPFQRLHGKNEYEGTGIGLAIVQKIIENHSGRITAKSKPGDGAAFILTLPLLHLPAEKPGELIY